MKLSIFGAFVASICLANPYPNPDRVPKDGPRSAPLRSLSELPVSVPCCRFLDVLRVQLAWDGSSDRFSLAHVVRENSGTPALFERAKKQNPLGSYHARIVGKNGAPLAHDATGTGQEFRKLNRALSFRFPMPQEEVLLIVEGENPKTGVREEIVREKIDPAQAEIIPAQSVESRLLQAASVEPSLKIGIYGEGYFAAKKTLFFNDAQRVVDALIKSKFPGVEQMEFHAIFAPSATALGSAKNLGMPVPERDSFLSLYFPYWHPFGRWYHIVYPTRELHYRNALGQVPYDYPIAVIDSADYWGVGNFNEIAAIPNRNGAFTYLLLHELGHFFGLNEEYEGGGPTELAFAPEIDEPWSQNITFLAEALKLKWKSLIMENTPIPTPTSHWQGKGPYGAFKGGYADTKPLGKSHKPGLNCVMESASTFCPICAHAIQEKIRFDVGG